MNNSKLKITHYRLDFVFLSIVFFLSSCNGTGNKQVADKPSSDSLFVNGLIEQKLGDSCYLISIPADYAIDVLTGPDFDVYYIQSTDTTQQALFGIGLYFGNHPTLFPPQSDSCRIEQHKSPLLDIHTEWTIYNCNGRCFIQAEIDNKGGEAWAERIHAFGDANSETELPKLYDIFRTMRKESSEPLTMLNVD